MTGDDIVMKQLWSELEDLTYTLEPLSLSFQFDRGIMKQPESLLLSPSIIFPFISIIVILNICVISDTDARSVFKGRDSEGYFRPTHRYEASTDYFESGGLPRGRRGRVLRRLRGGTFADSPEEPFSGTSTSEISFSPNNPSSLIHHALNPQNPQPNPPRLPPHGSDIPPNFLPESPRVPPLSPRHTQPVQVATTASDRLFHLKEKTKAQGHLAWIGLPLSRPVYSYQFNFGRGLGSGRFLLPTESQNFQGPVPLVQDRYQGSYDSHGSYRGKVRWLGLQDMEEGRHRPLVRVRSRVQRPRQPESFNPAILSGRGYPQGQLRQVQVTQPVWNSEASKKENKDQQELNVRVKGVDMRQVKVEVSEPAWDLQFEQSLKPKKMASSGNAVEEVVVFPPLEKTRGQSSEKGSWTPLSEVRKERPGKKKFSRTLVPSNNQIYPPKENFQTTEKSRVKESNKRFKNPSYRFNADDLHWEETKHQTIKTKLPFKNYESDSDSAEESSASDNPVPATSSFLQSTAALTEEEDLFETESLRKKKTSKLSFAKKRPEQGWEDWEVFNKSYKK